MSALLGRVMADPQTDPQPALPQELRDFLDDWRAEIAIRRDYFAFEHQAYDRWLQAKERIEYWLTGVAGALLAYAVQSYNPVLVPHVQWLAPVSWGLLLAAVVAGIRALMLLSYTDLLWMQRLMGERIVRKRTAGLERMAVWKKLGLDSPLSSDPQEEAEHAGLRENIESLEIADRELGKHLTTSAEKRLTALEGRVARYGRLRSILLVAGLATLVVLRLANL
jgi:hypothetical protein